MQARIQDSCLWILFLMLKIFLLLGQKLKMQQSWSGNIYVELMNFQMGTQFYNKIYRTISIEAYTPQWKSITCRSVLFHHIILWFVFLDYRRLDLKDFTDNVCSVFYTVVPQNCRIFLHVRLSSSLFKDMFTWHDSGWNLLIHLIVLNVLQV